jgi:hypothetical protein
MSAMNSGVIGNFIFNLCSSLGKKDRHTAPFSELFHCHGHCSSPLLLISMAIYVSRIVEYYALIFLILSRLLGEPIGRLIAIDPYMRLNPPEVDSPVLLG